MRYAILSILFLLSFFAASAQCPPGIVYLPNQAAVDAFVSDYPSCNVLEHLFIGPSGASASDITDLSGLDDLELITGNLSIGNNPNLSNLYGLHHIKVIEGSLEVSNNPALPHLSGFESLLSIGGALIIYGNATLNAPLFPRLNSIGINDSGESLAIQSNPNLGTLSGLQGVSNLTGSLTIYNNPLLSYLQGLNGLQTIQGRVTISSNNALTNLYGLERLKYLYNDLYVYQNPNLLDLTGLDSLQFCTGKMMLYLNNSMSNLAGPNALYYLGGLQVSNCHSLTNLSGLSYLMYIENNMEVYNNFSMLNLGRFYNLNYIGGYMYIAQNENLTEVYEVNNLGTVGGGLYIINNPNLSNIYGFSSIYNVGSIYIFDNDALWSLGGLNGLNPWSIGWVDVKFNDNLNICAVESLCSYMAIPGSSAYFYDNNYGCNSTAEVYGACFPFGGGAADRNSVPSPEAAKLRLFPNPGPGLFYIEGEMPEGALFEIRNAAGVILLRGQLEGHSIDLGTLPAGTYWLHIGKDKFRQIMQVQKL